VNFNSLLEACAPAARLSHRNVRSARGGASGARQTRRVARAACALFVSIGLVLPGHALAQNYPDSVKQLISATKKQVKTMTMQEFKAAYDRKAVGLLIDVRQEIEFDDGHVPGAINIPRGLIEFRIWKHVGFPDRTDMNTQMTLYCLTGARCAFAAKSLQDLGFTNVTSVDMRFEDWAKAGFPVAKPK
jgi:rhodanese-related sulfurtransferase